MLRALASLSEDGLRIEVRFPYSPVGLRAIRAVSGSQWNPKKRAWIVALSLTSGRRLREEFGAGLEVDDRLRRWGRAEKRKQRLRSTLAQAGDGELARLPGAGLSFEPRPYQRADIALMAGANILNANEPGTGKTIEIIGTAAEADLLGRALLTFAPARAIENTWAAELRRVGYRHPILASEIPADRKRDLLEAARLAAIGEPFWLVSIPDLLRVKPSPNDVGIVRDPVSGKPFVAPHPQFFEIEWGLAAIDEFHKFGLTNNRSQFGLAARLLRADRKILASGTPMGGKFKRLWAALNWLYPDVFGSWWRWAGQWLVIEDNGFGKIVRDEIQPGREEEFRADHAPYMCRRKRLDELPGCPAQVHRTIVCEMTKQQRRQYEKFERDAEIRISDRRLSGHGILAEWGRLRQFSNATCRTTIVKERTKIVATADSGKLPHLIEALDEQGVRKSQPEPRARAIVGSMDKSFAKIVARYLDEHGIETGLLTGDTQDSRPLIERFRGASPKPYVLVMTIQTGGVSLNLEEAGSIHALDEDWDPDSMKQFFDRGDRGSRTTPLNCFTYRSRGTIQEYIAEVAAGKRINNRNALEMERLLARARTHASGRRAQGGRIV